MQIVRSKLIMTSYCIKYKQVTLYTLLLEALTDLRYFFNGFSEKVSHKIYIWSTVTWTSYFKKLLLKNTAHFIQMKNKFHLPMNIVRWKHGQKYVVNVVFILCSIENKYLQMQKIKLGIYNTYMYDKKNVLFHLHLRDGCFF